MNQSRKKMQIGSEIYSRSPSGLWVRAILREEGIELQWQARTSIVDGSKIVFDLNGSVIEKIQKHEASKYDGWVSAGLIRIEDSFVKMCGATLFDAAISAVMIHASHMVTCGYGEDADEIVKLFSDFSSFSFMDGVSYMFRDTDSEYAPLNGRTSTVSVTDGEVTASINIGTESVETVFDKDIDIIKFLINTIPV